jgi:mobilization protein MobC
MAQDNQLQNCRLRRLNIRLTQQEWDKVHKHSCNTTCRSVSEYARKILLEKPVKVFYRNQSFDDFEENMTRVLPQLETFGNNFSQLVKKISSLENVPEIKAILAPLLECAQGFSGTAEAIRGHIEKLSDLCDPK